MRDDGPEVEALARPEVRARLSPWRLLWLYLAGMAPLAASAAADPLLIVPIVGLELGFSASVCMLVTALAVYVVLGLEP